MRYGLCQQNLLFLRHHPFVITPAQKTDQLDQPAFIRASISFFDALQEALGMHLVAHKRCRFNNE
jgi:hypothetical protein